MVPSESQISRPPSRIQIVTDTAFRSLCYGFAWLSVLLVAFIILKIVTAALPAVRQYGLDFLTGRVWDPKVGTQFFRRSGVHYTVPCSH